jgi:hypothetical protein
MTMRPDYAWAATRTATIVDVGTLIGRFARSGDYTLEKLGGRFYVQAGRSVNARELVSLVESELAAQAREQARDLPAFMTTVLQSRAGEVAAKLVDDAHVIAEAEETFFEVAVVQRAGGTSSTVGQTMADLSPWLSEQ